ncbi:YetF domain-containing protein [Gracilibacillus sp. YIM 98692]|uniref:DUF421 domain-containing protein n=1 Tax=Gracilibacillus sp. YIM 98692 TaxID=2663532 RepID=UPI0013D73F86|nr:YetF domain-containing protein [Gracilibacillus sp. YIM 98692]
MLLFIGKISLLFLIYVIAIRLLGKSALAQLTPHDFGAIFFLAYILFGSIEINSLIEGITGGIVIIVLYISIARLSLWNKLSKYIIGNPTFLIRDGKILKNHLQHSRFTVTELLSTIRTAGYSDIRDVNHVLLEPNGKISIIPKSNKAMVTPDHLNLPLEDKGISIAVIIEGKIQHNNLKSINKDEQWLKSKLHSMGRTKINNILLATVRDKDYFLDIHSEQS